MLRKIISLILTFCLLSTQTGFAQVAAELNIAGHLASLHNSLLPDTFRPLHLRFLSFNPLDNSFKLLLDKGDFMNGQSPSGTDPEDNLKEETGKLMQYFLIGLTLPNDTFWVNLRPDSPDQIIDDRLAQTDIGKIMFETDLQLKKDTASFTSPQTPEGREYWDKLYKKAEELYGTDTVTIPTLTRPWIVPGEIIIRETTDSAYIYKATLKVMLEQDYLKNTPNAITSSADYTFKDQRSKALNEYSTQLIRELIIPKLTKEVNSSRRYASLRQVYYSLIMAQWFKARYKKGLFPTSPPTNQWREGTVPDLIDSKNLADLTSKEDWSKTTYFNAYKKSFAEGEYNIQEPHYTPTGQVIRSYFSGGVQMGASSGIISIPAISASPVFNNTGSQYLSLSSSPLKDTFTPIEWPTFASKKASSAIEESSVRENSLRTYLARNIGQVVRVDLVPPGLYEETNYFMHYDYICEDFGSNEVVFNITKGKIFERDKQTQLEIKRDISNSFRELKLFRFKEKIIEAVKNRKIYGPFRKKILSSKDARWALDISAKEAMDLLQETDAESFSQKGLIIKDLELGNVIELHLGRFSNNQLETTDAILDNNLDFCFDEIGNKYEINDLTFATRELIKNAVIHGNKMNLKFPIFLHFDKNKKQMEVYDLSIKEDATVRIPKTWSGHHRGVAELILFWKYNRETITDKENGLSMTKVAIRPSASSSLSATAVPSAQAPPAAGSADEPKSVSSAVGTVLDRLLQINNRPVTDSYMLYIEEPIGSMVRISLRRAKDGMVSLPVLVFHVEKDLIIFDSMDLAYVAFGDDKGIDMRDNKLGSRIGSKILEILGEIIPLGTEAEICVNETKTKDYLDTHCYVEGGKVMFKYQATDKNALKIVKEDKQDIISGQEISIQEVIANTLLARLINHAGFRNFQIRFAGEKNLKALEYFLERYSYVNILRMIPSPFLELFATKETDGTKPRQMSSPAAGSPAQTPPTEMTVAARQNGVSSSAEPWENLIVGGLLPEAEQTDFFSSRMLHSNIAKNTLKFLDRYLEKINLPALTEGKDIVLLGGTLDEFEQVAVRCSPLAGKFHIVNIDTYKIKQMAKSEFDMMRDFASEKFAFYNRDISGLKDVIPDGSMALAVNIGVLEFIDGQKAVESIKEMGRILAPGGIGIVQDLHDTEVRDLRQNLPDNVELITEDWAKDIFVFKKKEKDSSSSPFESNSIVGGIDFRSLPIFTQALTNLSVNISSSAINRLSSLNLDEEWRTIEKMASSGIKPSSERIREYAQASSALDKISQDKDKIILCISDILRQEEEQNCETDPLLRDILVVLESVQQPQELKEVFLGRV